MEQKLDIYMKEHKQMVFTKVIVSPDVSNGLNFLIQSAGLGGLVPNTVMISWPTEWEHDVNKINRFVQMINNATTFGHVIGVLKPEKEF